MFSKALKPACINFFSILTFFTNVLCYPLYEKEVDGMSFEMIIALGSLLIGVASLGFDLFQYFEQKKQREKP